MPRSRTRKSTSGIPKAAQEALGAHPPEDSAVPTVRAVEFVRRMRGASQPYLLRCDDGQNYVVKFRNNPQHVRVLANEMLASRLAQVIGLPVPSLAFVDVPPQLIQGTSSLGFEIGTDRVPCLPGTQFGSRFPGIPGQTMVVDFLPDRLLKRVTNLFQLFPGALVFDKWTCNCDGRQVIFYRAGEDDGLAYSACLIDQGFCFNDGEWSFPDSPIRSIYPRRWVYDQVRGLSSFEPFLSTLENIERAQLEACARDIPTEWCGDNASQLDPLIEGLFQRRLKVRQALIEARDCALKPFPNWN